MKYGVSQEVYTIHYNDNEIQGKHKLPKYLKCDTSKKNQIIQKKIRELNLELIERGYFLNEITLKDSTKKCIVNLGAKFSKILLRDSIDLNKGIFNRINAENYFSPKNFAQYLENKITGYLNSGYPFVNVQLKNVTIKSNQISSSLHISKGKYSVLKKIHIKGDSSISINTIQSIIGISIGDAYSENAISIIDDKISQNNFINTIRPSEILYTNEGHEIFLYVKSDRASFLRGAIGLQPNPVSQRMALTGEVNLKLQNALKKGELFKLNWRSIRPQTQRLNINFDYPFLFQSPFGTSVNFLLYKRDSTFLDLNAEFNVSYRLNNGLLFRAHYRYINSNLLSGAFNSNEFQSLSSYSTNAYGLSIEKKELDNIINPSKGRIFESKIYVGQRRLNSDSLSASNTTFTGHFNYKEFIQILKRHVLLFAGDFDLYSSPVIYQNELFRFGGLNNLRGFNEEELFASVKAQLTIEYRFLLDKSSNVFIFYDQCMYENRALQYFKDKPFGFGSGISFGSKIGVFNITYALGKKFSNPIDFRSSKIHFGYTTYF
ncbi:MAG: hypothetical protein ISP70_03665 [Crocinitomicaceae bacterium]|nr:hypothetical protein [Crocinitomicaceae bacterium]